MTDEERHALTEATEKLRRAADKLRQVAEGLPEVARQSVLLAKHYDDCARRIESFGQMDSQSSDALAEAVRLLGEP